VEPSRGVLRNGLAHTRVLISRQIFQTLEDFGAKSLISSNKATSHSEAASHSSRAGRETKSRSARTKEESEKIVSRRRQGPEGLEDRTKKTVPRARAHEQELRHRPAPPFPRRPLPSFGWPFFPRRQILAMADGITPAARQILEVEAP
jgi:hypothetical protein